MILESIDNPVLLRDQVYNEVKRAIITGDLKPGKIIKEGELAKTYGISKTPVREALCMLVFEKLIQPLPRIGYMVTSITVRDVRETHHLRQLLEVEAVGLAAEHITREEIEALKKVMVSHTGEEAPTLNREFHMIIARASGNSRLADLIHQLLDEMDRIFALDPHIYAPNGPYEHPDIVMALERRDAKAAREIMNKHVTEAQSRILQRF